LLEPIDIFAMPMTINKYHDTAVIGTNGQSQLYLHNHTQIASKQEHCIIQNCQSALSRNKIGAKCPTSPASSLDGCVTSKLDTSTNDDIAWTHDPPSPSARVRDRQTSHFSLHLNSHESLILETRPFSAGRLS
jgi:hypothetical protein